MTFNEFDTKMRIFETSADLCVLPSMFMVARLDGRSFTRLTKDICPFDVPFDSRFRDMMISTAKSLMACGFRVVYAYTESDEISLLLDRDEKLFGRKLRKYDSILAGEASAQFSVQLGQPACFDCRISQLPNAELVVDYFRWRSEDAARNALSSWCYWTLRKDGDTEQQATNRLRGLSLNQKHDLLFEYGINFNDLPNWQKRGIGLYWEVYERIGVDGVTSASVSAHRRRIRTELDLPMKDDYSQFVRSMISQPIHQGA